MTEGEMKKVSAWIPQETLTKLEEKGYHNRAEAIRLGLEYLLLESNEEPIKEPIWNPTESTKNAVESNGIQYEIMKAQNEGLERRHEIEKTYLKKEIERLTVALQESPDPVELAKAQAHFEGLQRLLEEKDERIKDLSREVERLDIFAHYFKSTEPKLIEAQAAEKKSLLSRLKFW